MKSSTRKIYNDHNNRQKEYFSQSPRQAMIPKDSPYLQRHVDEVIRFADITQGERVLEVGCGMGRNTFILAGKGIQIEGMDLTPELLDKLRAFDQGKYNIPLHCTDVIEHSPELNNSFDAVIGFFTLHHVHGIPACYEAMAQMAKPGGRIVFLEPNPFNLLYYLQIIFTPTMKWSGERGISKMRKSIIFKAMQKAGLEDLQMEHFGFFPPFIANHSYGRKVETVLEKVPIWRPLLPFRLFKGIKK